MVRTEAVVLMSRFGNMEWTVRYTPPWPVQRLLG